MVHSPQQMTVKLTGFKARSCCVVLLILGLLVTPVRAAQLLQDEGQITAPQSEVTTLPDLNALESDGSLPLPLPNVRIVSDLDTLPPAVRAFYDRLMTAALTGEVENLRGLFGARVTWPQLGFDDYDDPITFLKDSSNDGEARETLAILIEIMESDFAIVDEGTDRARYVWPYFAEVNLEKLSSTELVQMYKLVAYQDLEEMLMFGSYFFFRLGIDKDGNWQYFLAGD